MIKIGNRNIGKNYKPFIVAEMSGNHNQSLKKAIKIIDKAADCGVDAVKIQTYTPDTLTINSKRSDFKIEDKNSLWKNQTLYELYQKAYTPWEWHKTIFSHCKKRNLICFSSPFDSTAVDFLHKNNVPAYKIASFEINNIPLIEQIAKKKKPMIISTGLASFSEIKEVVKISKKNGCKKIILLKCTSSYPAEAKDSNIATIRDLQKKFNCEVGLSDHTKGIGVSIASISHGATFIEKHFTLDRKEGGVDSEFSMEPDEMKQLVIESNRAWLSLGKIFYGSTKSEKKSIKFRKSIYVIKKIKKNEKFTKNNIKIIRPGYSLEPKYFNEILGLKSNKNFEIGDILKKSNIVNFKK